MIFERKKYLDELIAGRGNGLVKINGLAMLNLG